MINWTEEKESLVMAKRAEGMTYQCIGELLGTTGNSVKHKVRRIRQRQDDDRYKHTVEKQSQIRPYLASYQTILETHCGYGGLTDLYHQHGLVTCWDICQYKIDHVMERFNNDVNAKRTDSEKESLVAAGIGLTWDVIDVDPYGFPSRLFPHVFRLLSDKSLLAVTFPMMGVAQINKITIRHYQAFWGIELSDKDRYIELISRKLRDYAFMAGRKIEVLDVMKVGRIYRILLDVERTGLDKLVGLRIIR